MALIAPKLTTPGFSPMQGATENLVGYLQASDLFQSAMPFTVIGATRLESSPVYVQGFSRFQGWVNATGTGTLMVEYGICHPVTLAVLGYRTLFAGAALSASMIATFGRTGQAAVALQGDLYTVVTIRFSAATLSVTINDALLWAGV